MRWQREAFVGVPAGNGDSTAIVVDDLVDKWIQISGTFSATANVQGTINGNDWLTIGSLTAGGFIEVPQAVKSLRINISGFASGQVVATLAARHARTE